MLFLGPARPVRGMRVKIIEHPDYRAGDVVDLPPATAVDLLRAGQATAVAAKRGDDAETR